MPYLVSHEIFVVDTKVSGAAVAFAAAAARLDIYLLREIRVAPALRHDTVVGAALLNAVTQRARWFHHRALVVAADIDSNAASAFDGIHGFVKVSRQDSPADLIDTLGGEAIGDEAPISEEIRVKWL
ncbi:hypothetical protein LQ948_16630 [Jiella sp. MQZ9-1]|uniref:Uncharacterized protein n=1 Tax=Jiella flava TaxID=2816857 RepID=A0A939JTN6_9HYPH|nr:hypothetical protein [Jiella flava]MBO0664188.1 hypothetical protein [Jiella flava]MCD2472835.1 hypothetical protein [Jiella flava]